MAKKLVMVNGSKGGVGKSTVSMAAIDTALEKGEKVLLIETDTSNADVYKSYKEHVSTMLCNLDVKEGWLEFLNAIHNTEADTIIVNTAARGNDGLKAFGGLLRDALPELDCAFSTLWIINRQRDSLILLKEFREQVPGTLVHVVRNLYWGEPEKFELFNTSQIKTEIEASGGQVLDFPDLADRVADLMMNTRMPISAAATQLDFGERIEAQRWRSDAWASLGKVI